MNKNIFIEFITKLICISFLLVACFSQPVPEFDPIEKVFASQILQDVGGSYIFGPFPKQVSKVPCQLPQYVPGGEIQLSATCETILRKEDNVWVVEFKQVWSETSELTHTWVFRVDRYGEVIKCTSFGAFPPQFIHMEPMNKCKDKP